MYTNNKDPRSDELQAMRPLAKGGGEGPGDRLLGMALSGLYTDRLPEGPGGEGWSAIEAAALGIAARRRRWRRLREMLFGIHPARLLLYAGVAALILLLPRLVPGPQKLAELAPAPRSVPAAITAAQASLDSSSDRPQSALLLNGAQLHLSRGSAQIDQADRARPRIVLHSGILGVKVPKLGSAGKLVVATAEAEVIVHGTQFAVSRLSGDRTSVRVHEGLVEVRPLGTDGRQPVFLRAGEHVDVAAADRYLEKVTQKAREIVAKSSCDDPDGSLEAYLKSAPASEDRSAALYLVAYCAALRGDRDRAVAVFTQVAETSGNSARADNALARVAQLLAERSKEEGRAAWQHYLSRFPQGLHTQSARDFLAGEALP